MTVDEKPVLSTAKAAPYGVSILSQDIHDAVMAGKAVSIRYTIAGSGKTLVVTFPSADPVCK